MNDLTFSEKINSIVITTIIKRGPVAAEQQTRDYYIILTDI